MKKLASLIAISLAISTTAHAQSTGLFNEDGSNFNLSLEIYCGLPFTKTLSSSAGTTLSNYIYPYPAPPPKAPFINSTNINANTMRFFGTAPDTTVGSPIIGSIMLEVKNGSVVLMYHGLATWVLERADTSVAPALTLNMQPGTTINISDEIRSRYPFASNALDDIAAAKTRTIGVTGSGIHQENGDFIYGSSASGGETVSASYIVNAAAQLGENCTHRAESTVGSISINVATTPEPETPEVPEAPEPPLSASPGNCKFPSNGDKIVFRYKC